MNSPSKSPDTSPSWIERHVNLIIIGLIAACAVTLIAQAVLGLGFDETTPLTLNRKNGSALKPPLDLLPSWGSSF